MAYIEMSSLLVILTNLRNRHFFLLDCLLFGLTPFLAVEFRCLDICPDFHRYTNQLLIITPVFLLIKVIFMLRNGFYNRFWRYASVDELVDIGLILGAATLTQTLVFHGIRFFADTGVDLLPRSLPITEGLLATVLVGLTRFSIRITEEVAIQARYRNKPGERVLIAGAGSAGISLLQTIQHDRHLQFTPIGFIDDNPRKQGMRVRGLPVLGNRRNLADIVNKHRINSVLIAMPSASGAVIRDIVQFCQCLGIKTKTLPGLNEILGDTIRLETLRSVKIEDLLRRDPIQTDFHRISSFLKGQRVLITGAGGSIGSELCRQILKCEPTEILLLGHGENSIFLIHQELQQILETYHRDPHTPKPILKTCIADIRFRDRLNHVFATFRPDVVFHAAAHKHVPLMELNVPEAITNNILGTRNLVDAALLAGVEHLVMISTDKAVNPTSVMGVSKRVAEMLVLRAAQQTQRAFVVVRFGNVLGSRGSVIPTFLQQIAAGGPITITHPEIRRFFMTIPEAVQLVLQASVLGHGGEVFTLDMGDPLKILHLAEDLIRLSGYQVNQEIKIVFTGLRPGEKLFEELFISGENYQKTKHEKILIATNASQFVAPDLDAGIHALLGAAQHNDQALIVALLQRLVSEYTPEPIRLGSQTVLPGLPATAAPATTFTPPATSRPQQPQQEVLETSKWIASGFARATTNNDFPMPGLELHYQPILGLKSQKVVGFEALLRCSHPQKGLLLGKECLDMAATQNLIAQVGNWAVAKVCAQAAAWHEFYDHCEALQVSVNLSSQEFYQPDLIPWLQAALAKVPLDPAHLHLEIPGFVLAEEPELAADILLRLKRIGLRINIDNLCDRDLVSNAWQRFIQHLRVPVDQVKLDRSFVQQIDPESQTRWQASGLSLHSTAQRLGAEMVAVGIDDSCQLPYLESIQCHYAQGFWFSAPVNAAEAHRFLESTPRQRMAV